MLKGPLKQSYLPLGIASGSLLYLLNDDFDTADQPPITSPRNAEPGPGTLTITDTGVRTGILQDILWVGPGMGSGDPYIRNTDGYARVNGRMFQIRKIKRSGVAAGIGDPVMGWATSLTVSVNNVYGTLWSNAAGGLTWNIADNGAFPVAISLMLLPDYITADIVYILDDRGYKFFRIIDNKMTLLWKGHDGTQTPMYPVIYDRSAGALPFQIEQLIVRDLKVPTFNSEYGAASFNITSFTQSLGAELVTNGDFANWTGDNPNNWTVNFESGSNPAIHQVGAGEGHLGVGTGLANIYSTAVGINMQQNLGEAAGDVYEISYDVSFDAGTGSIYFSIGGKLNRSVLGANGTHSAGKDLITATNANDFGINSNNFTHDITLDNVSVKKLTLNAQQVGTADAINQLFFIINATAAGARVELRYRIVDSLNYWVAYLVRNHTNAAWDFRLDSVAAGVATNRINVASITTPDAMMVIVNADRHICYTHNSGGGWVARGSEIGVSHLDHATGVNAIYTQGAITPSRLVSFPMRSANYDSAMIVGAPPTYQFKDNFYTSLAAPVSSPHAGEPSGSITLVQVDGNFSIAGGKLIFPAQASAVLADQGFYSTNSFARVAGRGFFYEGTLSTFNNSVIGWLRAQNLNFTGGANMAHALYNFTAVLATLENASSGPNTPITLTTSVSYKFVIVLRDTGAFGFIKGGTINDWALAWVFSTDSTTPLYIGFSNMSSVGAFGYLRIFDLPAPFDTDYGIAFTNQTVFTQSAGAELLTNGNLETWTTSTNAGTWAETLGGTTTITQDTDAGDVHGGTSAVRFDVDASASSGTLTQPLVNALGDIIEISFWGKAGAVTNTPQLRADIGITVSPWALTTSYAQYGYVIRTDAVNDSFRILTVGGNSQQIYADDISVKILTKNTAQAMPADAVLDFEFTQPASPYAGQEIHLVYKIQASGEEFLNCWDAYIRRNVGNTSWDFRLDSITAGTRTNRISVGSIGATINGIRINVEGLTHDAYTFASSVWTKRGSAIAVSGFDNARLANTIYSTGTTPTRLAIYPKVGYVDVNNPLINITVDGQSLGAELLANPSFVNWTADNPDNWTVSGESGSNPEVTERQSGNNHAAAVGTGDAANFFSSATANQPRVQQVVMTIGRAYEFTMNPSVITSGSPSQSGLVGVVTTGWSVTGQKKTIGIASTTTLIVFSPTATSDYTIDDVSLKLITQNQQQVAGADGLFQLDFTLPVSPTGSQEIILMYRIQDQFNYWAAYLRRNTTNTQWDLRLDSVAAGVPTNRINSTNVGSVIAIRVKAVGNIHVLESSTDGTTWTHQSTINQGVMVGNFGLNYMYSSGFGFTALKYYPFIRSYDALENI